MLFSVAATSNARGVDTVPAEIVDFFGPADFRAPR
jgi:hypothetical protein